MTDKEPCSYKRGGLTYEAKDVADGRHKDNEQIHQEDETEGNADVNDPTEGLVREEDLKQSPADLPRGGPRGRTLLVELRRQMCSLHQVASSQGQNELSATQSHVQH